MTDLVTGYRSVPQTVLVTIDVDTTLSVLHKGRRSRVSTVSHRRKRVVFPATPPPRARRRMTHRLLQLALIIIGVDVVHAHRVFLGVDCLVKSDHASALGDF
ncbi:hypothetical protein DPMN_044096 [Dreissena polymorpha]|uniref:Uncharacterized protein n=1 Tax=Dreissena polymorpha TaxID=45954 RepID=A0A9D4D1S5_DREPO|nr:hypothetical protein DPMN_044096 [Dreissena polymorpha]